MTYNLKVIFIQQKIINQLKINFNKFNKNMSLTEYYDRYQKFRENGQVKLVPFVKLHQNGSDIIITFDKSKMRLDALSYKYYGDPNYGWLILLANPKYGSMEFEIPDGVGLRIPYPLNVAISGYEEQLDKGN